jgi:hypothetical protein
MHSYLISSRDMYRGIRGICSGRMNLVAFARELESLLPPIAQRLSFVGDERITTLISMIMNAFCLRPYLPSSAVHTNLKTPQGTHQCTPQMMTDNGTRDRVRQLRSGFESFSQSSVPLIVSSYLPLHDVLFALPSQIPSNACRLRPSLHSKEL